MDAHFFRCLALELGPALTGARLGKVFQPAPDVWTFETGLRGAAFLVLRHGRAGGLLFATAHKPANPDSPSAHCMWLRKRLRGRRVTGHAVDLPGRVLALSLTPGDEDDSPWLVLDLAEGPSLAGELSPAFGTDVGMDCLDWPTLDRAANDADVWREFPQITPALRRSLHGASAAHAAAVWRAVRSGACGPFRISGSGEALAWPAPDGEDWEEMPTAMEAAEAAGRRALFPELARRDTADDAARLKAEQRRLKKALASVDRDEARLRGMAALAEDGQAIKAVLHVHGPEARLERVEVPGPDDRPDGSRILELDRRLTLVGNMERLFARAAKGRRGLDFVAGRRKELQARLDALLGGAVPEPTSGGRGAPSATAGPQGTPPGLPRKMRGLAVAAFRTDDGLAAFRGKSAKGNHELLSRGAAPHDLWFHAANGPGSHVVLKLDYPGQEPPRRSLEQAAVLAGLRSHWAGPDMRPGTRAEVLCAVVRDVRKVKGAALGSVVVDKVFRTLLVDLDPDLERRLAV